MAYIYINNIRNIYIYIYSDGILSDILFGIYSGILSDICSGILSGILPGIYSEIVSGIYSDSDVLSGIYPGVLVDILSDILCALTIEVPQCPLRSGSRSWGPAVPTELWRSPLRSGSARWDLALAVEVRQRPLRFGARFEELEDEKEKEKEEEGCIKSRDPHLAGGEKVLKSESMSKRWRQWLALNVWLVQNCSSRFKPLELFSYKVAEDQPRELNLDFGYRSWRLRRALRYATV